MKTNLVEITNIARGTGKTYAICEAAKKISATVIVNSLAEKSRIEKLYGVKATTFDNEIRGTKGPYLVDTHAVSVAAIAYEDNIAQLQAELATLRAQLSLAIGHSNCYCAECNKLTKFMNISRDASGEGSC